MPMYRRSNSECYEDAKLSVLTFCRLGEATYSNNEDSTTSFLNFTIETDKVTGAYDDIVFTTTSKVEYHFGEQIEAGRIRTSYSVQLSLPSGSAKPSCAGDSQQVISQYVTEDEVYLTFIGNDVPDQTNDAEDIQVLYNLVSRGFLENINGAAEDLFINVGKQALSKVCN
uniref:Uncharacterized protein n=1 Tax=Lygus hesperus TaxID=30085 RepID=A0A0K8T5V6_LYGHE